MFSSSCEKNKKHNDQLVSDSLMIGIDNEFTSIQYVKIIYEYIVYRRRVKISNLLLRSSLEKCDEWKASEKRFFILLCDQNKTSEVWKS